MTGSSPVPLSATHLADPTTDGIPVHLWARVTRIEPRMTSQDLPWAILHLTGQHLKVRGLVFPNQWDAAPPLNVGQLCSVFGTLAFRDGDPVLRVLRIDA